VFFVCLKLPGTANALILFGFAFDAITVIREEKARIRGIFRGKKSLGLPCFDKGEIDNAACTGGTNSDKSTFPFHGLTDIEFEFEFGGEYLHADRAHFVRQQPLQSTQ
jgi:hypothetical protein